ncbi:VCBS repeat-containing protein [Flavihumibacter profundi]|uniref:VCBS repeat-containing protein n=1 Tax=Flavihumibacter profundi TaxID=2716883 RepID=UPI001CC58B55|nr:VCBS repeat-containing protein [Flavihumibacter profundi]MBZ5857808.1 VCBS repeat-containing protein [Flavihumibacter profundi]
MNFKIIEVNRNIFFYTVMLGLLLASCRQENKQFSSVSPSASHIQFENKLEKHKLFSILYYLYYYNGGGVATGDINNDGLADIYFTANNKGGNKLYLNKGNFEFEDITEKAGVAGTSDWCTGVTMADINGDGLLDIYVSAVANRYGLKGRNELYINKGNGHFAESAAAYGLDASCFTTQTAFFDYDHDGDLDCYILNQSHHPHANITDTSFRHKYDSLSGDRLLRNDISTTGKFTDVSAQAGIYQSSLGYGLGIAIGDLNNDGWDDIYIGNDFHENDYYYVNNGNGTFTESGAGHFRHYSRFSMGNDIADYNNDGQLDVVTVDMLPSDEKILKTYGSDENPDTYKFKLEKNGYQQQYSKNCLQRNNGNGTSFSDISLMAGVSATDWSWCPLIADFDNDGRKDLFITSGIVRRPVDLDYVRFVSDLDVKKGRQETDAYDEAAISGMPDGASHPYFYKGMDDHNFQDKSADWGTAKLKGYFNGASYADLDNDGDLDLVINSINSPALVLKNTVEKKNYIRFNLKGNAPNTFGIGAKIYLFSKGKMQFQQVMATRGFQSASDTRPLFGLDSAATIDSLLVVWPGQDFQLLKNIKAGQTFTLQESAASGRFDHNVFFAPQPPVLSDAGINAGFRHKENNFYDYNVQYLIPHGESTRGPKLAVADVNGDGLDDFYVCGASGQEGQLMLQSHDGQFTKTEQPAFAVSAFAEDVDAIFFDADNDGDQDLYVVAGGNEYPDGNPLLADRLYINNGKGNFSLDSDALPKILTNKSCVSAADIDKDGDIDLFVGGLANAKAYGLPQDAYLLLNDGKGKFKVADGSIIASGKLGIVTASSFADFDKDGYPDLVVSGEWMPVKIFHNDKGHFIAMDIAKSTGLWQSVVTTDINGDGFPDILAGNWGHNSKLFAGKNGPVKLYVKDFDNNGSIEQVMAYTVDGKEYPFLAKDELERALPVLKKAYLKYSEVAGKTVDYILYDLFKDYTELKAETLSSTCFINDGKGNFTATVLPDALQEAPVFSFTRLDTGSGTSFLAAGNFYNVVPFEGRYDALCPTFFSYQKNPAGIISKSKLPAISGEIRDLKWLQMAGGKKLLAIARNNDTMLFLKLNNE